MIVLYMLGCFRMKHDSALEAIGGARLTVAIFFLAATIWLIPGLFGRELGELESFFPPVIGTTASGSASSTASSGQKQPEWILNNHEGALQVAKPGNSWCSLTSRATHAQTAGGWKRICSRVRKWRG
jgi:hypothetical protein